MIGLGWVGDGLDDEWGHVEKETYVYWDKGVE